MRQSTVAVRPARHPSRRMLVLLGIAGLALTIGTPGHVHAAPRPGPDLQVTAVSDPPATGSPGDVIDVTDTTANSGRQSRRSLTGLLLSEDTQRDPGDVLLAEARQVPRMKDGEESTGTTEAVIPIGTASGAYHVLACADITSSVREDDETNNCAASAGTISVAPPVTAFRLTDVAMRDPHVYIALAGALDITTTVNSLTRQQMSEDADGDGVIDLSHVNVFQPIDPGTPTSETQLFLGAACVAPLALLCGPGGQAPVLLTATNLTVGLCLSTLPGTTNPNYSPPITESTEPCFSTAPTSLALDLGWVTLPLQEARIGATYDGDPVTGEVNGLIRGFLSEAAADATMASFNGLDLVLSSMLPGGTGSPVLSLDDMDNVNGVWGWWVYINFAGASTDWTG